ncbi:hypothetical protein AS359_02750 [Comamonas kerstersii]|uniref:Uncharacterized protein n=1 Tax=Comamonas kerstersii TaxID=225992 RepID=A0A0W7YZA9_9BURK|nr:hypothetical protein AS359_02750 [Comamonas kerstersii]
MYTVGGSAELPFFHQLLHFINGSRACMCPPWLSSEAHMTAATDIGRSHAQRTRGLPSKGRTKARNMDALSKDGVDRRLALSLVRQMLTKTRIL